MTGWDSDGRDGADVDAAAAAAGCGGCGGGDGSSSSDESSERLPDDRTARISSGPGKKMVAKDDEEVEWDPGWDEEEDFDTAASQVAEDEVS